ncbi:hypothetical protein [Stakelama sediminis]|nr:hypothetical protein [Stakelama sediminis]
MSLSSWLMMARRFLWGGLIVLALLALSAFVYARSMTPKLQLGVGYAARVACGCRYIEGRPLKSCYSDYEPGMAPIRLKDDPATKTVTAYVPLVASRSARFDALLGCRPTPFRGTPLKVH